MREKKKKERKMFVSNNPYIAFGYNIPKNGNLRAIASQVNHGDIPKQDVVDAAKKEIQSKKTNPLRSADLKGLLRNIGVED